MPFIRGDAAAYDEIFESLAPDDLPPGFAEKRPSGEFEYEAASEKFAAESLGPVAQTVLHALLGVGVTRFRVRYDGGYDEGFAHPDAFLFGEQRKAIPGVLVELASAGLIADIRRVAGQESMWGNAQELYAGASQEEALNYALDELAQELAWKLLGNGFGTGEYELYGAFTADLKTGELVDDPSAEKPDSVE